MMVEVPILGRNQGFNQEGRNVAKMNIRPVLDEELVDGLAIGRYNAGRDLGVRRFELLHARQAALDVPHKKGEKRDRDSNGDENISTTFAQTGGAIFSVIYSFTCPIGSRTCCIESRSRMVTV